MNKPGNKKANHSDVSAKVSWTDPGVLFFLVEMIAEKRVVNSNPFYAEGKLGTATVELPVSGSTILSHNNGFDKVNFATRFIFTCVKEKRGTCVFQWLSSLN